MALLACTKEDSFVIPLHGNSYAWLMSNSTHIYSNSKGDSLISGTITEVKSTFKEGLMFEEFPAGTVAERYVQTINIDTIFEYETNLLTDFMEGSRQDKVFIDGLGINLFGEAEPNFALSADYSDTLFINGIGYIGVYSKISNTGSEGLFVNLNDGLVAFITERDTFNLVN